VEAVTWGPTIVYYLDELKIAYIEIKKAGCTTVKTSLANYLLEIAGGLGHHQKYKPDIDGVDYNYGTSIHDEYFTWAGQWNRVQSLGDDWTVFTIAREPIERFVSAFYSNADRPFLYSDINEYITNHFLYEDGLLSTVGHKKINLHKFREDGHIVPQHKILANVSARIDYIGHLDDMDSASHYISSVIRDDNFKFVHANARPLKKLSDDRFGQPREKRNFGWPRLTKESLDILLEFGYRQDYELFDRYDPEKWLHNVWDGIIR